MSRLAYTASVLTAVISVTSPGPASAQQYVPTGVARAPFTATLSNNTPLALRMEVEAVAGARRKQLSSGSAPRAGGGSLPADPRPPPQRVVQSPRPPLSSVPQLQTDRLERRLGPQLDVAIDGGKPRPSSTFPQTTNSQPSTLNQGMTRGKRYQTDGFGQFPTRRLSCRPRDRTKGGRGGDPGNLWRQSPHPRGLRPARGRRLCRHWAGRLPPRRVALHLRLFARRSTDRAQIHVNT